MHHPLTCFIYTSALTPRSEAAVVATIVKQARELNAIHGITGVLIFDGERFAQYIEGPQRQIQQLALNLAEDPRHCEFQEHYCATSAQRRFDAWSMGYADVEDCDFDIETLRTQQGEAALAFFLGASKALDIA